LDATRFFGATVFFLLVLAEELFAGDLDTLALLFAFDPVFAPVLLRTLAVLRALLVRTCVTGARRTG